MNRRLLITCGLPRADGRPCGKVVGEIKAVDGMLLVAQRDRWSPSLGERDGWWELSGETPRWRTMTNAYALPRGEHAAPRIVPDEDGGDVLVGLFIASCSSGHRGMAYFNTLRAAFEAGAREVSTGAFRQAW